MLRIRLRYADVDAFVDKFAVNLSGTGMFIRSKTPKAVGTEIKYELVLADESSVIVGLGVVRRVYPYDPAQPRAPHGMGIEFTKLSRDSRAVIARIVERRRALELGVDEHGLPLALALGDDDAVPRAVAGDDSQATRSGPIATGASSRSGPIATSAVLRPAATETQRAAPPPPPPTESDVTAVRPPPAPRPPSARPGAPTRAATTPGVAVASATSAPPMASSPAAPEATTPARPARSTRPPPPMTPMTPMTPSPPPPSPPSPPPPSPPPPIAARQASPPPSAAASIVASDALDEAARAMSAVAPATSSTPAPRGLAPERPRQPRVSIEALLAAATPSAATSSARDDDLAALLDGELPSLERTLARARLLAGDAPDGELAALLDQSAAPRLFSADEASAGLSTLLGAPAIAARRRRPDAPLLVPQELATGTFVDDTTAASRPRPTAPLPPLPRAASAPRPKRLTQPPPPRPKPISQPPPAAAAKPKVSDSGARGDGQVSAPPISSTIDINDIVGQLEAESADESATSSGGERSTESARHLLRTLSADALDPDGLIAGLDALRVSRRGRPGSDAPDLASFANPPDAPARRPSARTSPPAPPPPAVDAALSSLELELALAEDDDREPNPTKQLRPAPLRRAATTELDELDIEVDFDDDGR